MSDNPVDQSWWLASDGKWYPPQSEGITPPLPPPPPASSDHPVDPTWWLASDGKYYPPHLKAPQQQSTPATAPPGSIRKAKVSKGITGSLQVLFWISSIMTGALITGSLVALNKFNTYIYSNAPIGSRSEEKALEESMTADDNLSSMIGLSVLLALVVFAVIIIWSFKAHKATQQQYVGPRSWTLGWSIGGWFLPFANIVIPKLVLTETEKIALSNEGARGPSHHWQETSSLPIGWVWWITFIAGGALFLGGSGMFNDPESTVSEWQTSYWLLAIGSILLLISCISGAFYFRRLGRVLAPIRGR